MAEEDAEMLGVANIYFKWNYVFGDAPLALPPPLLCSKN